MDIEDLLYNLTEDLVDDFDSLIIFRGIESNPALKNQIYDFIEIVSESISGNKNAQEKRILNSLIHYLKALIGYYDYCNIIDRSEHRAMSYVLEESGKSGRLKSELEYILEELNKGKRLLDTKEDASSVEFFDRSIDYIEENEVDRIHNIEKYNFERRLKEAWIDPKEIMQAISPQEMKNRIEREIEARKAACIREKELCKIYNASRWMALIFLLSTFIFLNFTFYLLFAIVSGLNFRYTYSLEENCKIYQDIIGFAMGFIFAPLCMLNWYGSEDRKRYICSRYKFKELNKVLDEINRELK